MAVDISKMQPYESPISHAFFPHLTIAFLLVGLGFTAWLFVYGVTNTKKARRFLKELFLAAIASCFLGFGTLFLMLWVGIYV